MSYPERSNFQSGEPLSAWWIINAGGPVRFQASQGRSVNRAIQTALRNAGIEGRLIEMGLRMHPVTVDGALGFQSLDALYRAAERLNTEFPNQGFAHIVSVIVNDRQQHTITRPTMRFAIWYAYARRLNTLRANWESVTLPTDALLPRYGVTPDDDRGASEPVIWNEGETPPTAGARAPAVSGSNNANQVRGSSSSSSALAPPVSLNWMDGETMGVSNKVVTGGGVLLAVAAVVAVVMASGKKKAPRRRTKYIIGRRRAKSAFRSKRRNRG